MKKVISPAIVTFYSSVGLIVAAAVAFTLYQGGLFLFQTQKMAHLEHQAKVLTARRQELQLDLAKKTALASLQPGVESGYETVSKPIIVKLNTTVAVR